MTLLHLDSVLEKKTVLQKRFLVLQIHTV